MIAQGMGGSIINLSSKSGLGPSKNNTAYNATKAGRAAHVPRWPWSLVTRHSGQLRRTGYVFEGSKIWNPESSRSARRNTASKPGGHPVLREQDPLGGEIKGQDVAARSSSVLDKARTITGQTLVPDAGQVMVR